MPKEISQSLKPSYFLISVSTRINLETCIKYALAGFPSGESGAWTFSEIQEGDFVSFLYGARAYNLYRVRKREAICDAQTLPPWEPLHFRETGRTYYFPFRLQLEPIRSFSESLVRAEFAYVAENLLLRGGYSKTHFQADQTTLQSVSQMGAPADGTVAILNLSSYKTFEPRFTRTKGLAKPPEITRFRETILQSAIRRHLTSEKNLDALLQNIRFGEIPAGELEVLGEKALQQGHIDILLKKRVPVGADPKIPIEVKTQKAQLKDFVQLQGYMTELRAECQIGILIAGAFHKQVIAKAKDTNVKLVRYSLGEESAQTVTLQELQDTLGLQSMNA